MVVALEELEREGVRVPKVGMFYDTTALTQVPELGTRPDLTTDLGRAYFYKMIRDFYSLIPPKYWAAIDGRPIVWLYSAAFFSKYDQGNLTFVDEHFRKDFGGRKPYIVREVSWNVKADNVYAWGAALNGPNFHGVLAIGPGYNDSAVPGRTTPIRDRENGRFYEESWARALLFADRNKGRNLAVIETWNELHEGTDICETREYGRQYIELTRKYSRIFKSGVIPDDLPVSKWAKASEVSILLGESNECQGLEQIEQPDGVTEPVEIGGRKARKPVRTQFGGMYVYFKVDDDFLSYADAEVSVTVTYYDNKEANFRLDYDSADPSATLNGAYKATKYVRGTGSNTWREYTFHLKGAHFANRQNGGADFRIAVLADKVYISKVVVRRSF